MPPIPDDWRFLGNSAWLLPEILRRSMTGESFGSNPDRESGDSAVLPRELQEMTKRPIGPPPDPPRTQPPNFPQLGGLVGLISKYEQWRRSASGSGDPPGSLDPQRANDQPPPSEGDDPNTRRLERVDETAARKRKRNIEYPSLVPNQSPVRPLGKDAAPGPWGKGPGCEKEIASAAKSCAKNGRELNTDGHGPNELFSMDDCIRALVSPECGGTKVKSGLTPEERARLNTERVRRIMNGEDPDY
jgi:hypothetical protein